VSVRVVEGADARARETEEGAKGLAGGRWEPGGKLYQALRAERIAPYLDIQRSPEKLAQARELAKKLVRKRQVLKRGNRKLDESILIFNLPDAYTCPNPSPACLRFCYARVTRVTNPRSAAISRYARYLLSLLPNFADIISRELESKKGVKAVRIHESGDFYSPAYFEKWLEVARRHPDVTFYAYTKSLFTLKYLDKLPSNFVLIYSLDKSNFGLFDLIMRHVLEARAKGKRVGISYVDTHTEEDRRNIEKISKYFDVHVCPATIRSNRGKVKCGRDCTYCMGNPECVVFNVH
jgi:hypothetical protein